jgi:hypothetical protein
MCRRVCRSVSRRLSRRMRGNSDFSSRGAHCGEVSPCGVLRNRQITQDAAVTKAHDALTVRSNFVFVRHDDDRLSFGVQLTEERQDLDRGLAVEISRGFVGEQNRWVIQNRSRDRNALPLTAGQLIRSVIDALRQSNAVKRRERTLPPTTPTTARVHQR